MENEVTEQAMKESTGLLMDLKTMPKIELHAHLSGCIRRETLHSIWLQKKQTDPAFDLPDPLLALPIGRGDFDLETFFPLFSKHIYALINDQQTIQQSTGQVLEDFEADGVIYLELRTTPRSIYPKDSQHHIPASKYISIICSLVRKTAHINKMTTRLILSIDRSKALSQIPEVIAIAKEHPDIIVGLDLSGDPTKGDVSSFAHLFKDRQKLGLGHLGTTVHFAEVPEFLSPKVGIGNQITELGEILSWNPDRLGHAIHIPESLKRKIRDGGIALELCLSCNIKARMLPGKSDVFSEHHLGEWTKSGTNPVIVCTDDPAIFLTSLSEEYALVREHFNFSDQDIKALARQGIESIFGGDEIKTSLRDLMWS